jgi:DNA-binding MarR family transcriptional regulator
MLIIRCRRLLYSAAARRLEEMGESMHLYRLLAELARNGPAPQRELAAATAQHPAAVSRLVDEMESQGLIRRRRGRRDRRQIIVAITARGRSRFRAARPVALAAVSETMAPLSARDQRKLAALLGKLLAEHQ